VTQENNYSLISAAPYSDLALIFNPHVYSLDDPKNSITFLGSATGNSPALAVTLESKKKINSKGLKKNIKTLVISAHSPPSFSAIKEKIKQFINERQKGEELEIIISLGDSFSQKKWNSSQSQVMQTFVDLLNKEINKGCEWKIRFSSSPLGHNSFKFICVVKIQEKEDKDAPIRLGSLTIKPHAISAEDKEIDPNSDLVVAVM
jgi:hypothetical protein